MKYDFIHLMPQGTSQFSIEFIKFVNVEFNPNEHFFVVIADTMIECLRNTENVKIENKKLIELLNYYAKMTDFLFIHSFEFSLKEIYFMKKEVLKKIIWCTWGHDLYNKYMVKENLELLSCFKKKLKGLLWNIGDYKLRDMKAMVVGIDADKEEASKRFKKPTILMASYTSGYFNKDIDSVPDNNFDSHTINILIGHSAFPFLQHKKYLDKLLPYSNEKIKIVLPLNYGDPSYTENIVNYACQLYPKDQIMLIRDKLSWNDYVKLLKSISIAIFDFDHQSALGNISLLLYLKKKIYLSANGVLAKTLKKENIHFYNCNDIGNVSFDTLCQHTDFEKGKEYANKIMSRESLLMQWINVFDFFKNEKK